MYLIVFLCTCLLILSLLSILAKQLPELQASVLSYGKLNLYNDKKPRTNWATHLSKLIVPKHYFCHFYIIGLFFALICIVELISFDIYQQPLLLIRYLHHYDNTGTHYLNKSTCLMGLILMTIHLTRRVYESLWVERASKTATMHVSHYLVGIGFYGAMVFGTWLEGLDSFGISNNNVITTQQQHISTFVAIVLFTYASYHQYNCHVILASLRMTNKGYSIPRGDWFECIVTPHYFADILIYLSLNLLYQFKNYVLLCGLIWTSINLSITANETQAWYQVHFSNYQKVFPHGRWRIIPFCY